jgi:serine phosphatase RsbU (regulator of sigma subunit)
MVASGWEGGLVLMGAELVLAAGLDAVPQARQFAKETLAGLPSETLDDAELLVAELVTNAFLHAGPPVTLRVACDDQLVRLEVQDEGHNIPMLVTGRGESMTGRGLSLVSALSTGWGVEGAPSGKIVWAEVSATPEPAGDGAEPEIDVDALLASWVTEEPAEPSYELQLGAVPTDLLLAEASHIDNLVRELILAKAEESMSGVDLPAPLHRLVRPVTTDFADARAEIKRQALAAAACGSTSTELVLHLPASAADAGERYLAALDEADRYARAERLLTLAAPRSHQIFRRWYVQSLVDQLRAVARQHCPSEANPFSQALADEVERLSWLEDTWDKLQLLQRVTAQLTAAHSLAAAAETVVDNAFEFLGVKTARVFLMSDDRMLRSIAVRGGNAALVPRYEEFSLDGKLPGAIVMRTAEPMLLRNVEQIAQRFPELARIDSSERSLHLVPLVIGGKALGLLNLSFPGSSQVGEASQVAFVGALADALAQALERILAMQRADEANERLAFLADASVALSESLDYQATLDAITELLVPRLADWCVVQLIHGDELRTVAVQHADPERLAWAKAVAARYPLKMDDDRGTAVVARSGRSELFPTLPSRLLERIAVDQDHLALFRSLGMSSLLVVPLTGRSEILGVVALVYAGSGRHYRPEDVSYVEDVVRRAGLALEAADTLREQTGRLVKVTRVAEAAQQAILAPPPTQSGPVRLAARYLSAAAEALIGGDLYEVVERSGAVRLLIGDVRGKGLAAVRTATVVLGEFRAAAADIDDLTEVAQQIDRRLRPYLGDEDFVTAVIAELTADGSYSAVSCGHPPPLVLTGGAVSKIGLRSDLPLGLGAAPAVTTGRLVAGDRLLLYTDGVSEARRPNGAFVDLPDMATCLMSGDLDSGLERLLDSVSKAIGVAFSDDIALLVAEYRPE